MERDEITSVRCHTCGFSIPPGMVDVCKCGADLFASQRRTTRIAIAHDFAKQASELVVRLEASGTMTADALASRGNVMVLGFLNWATDLPDQAERSRQIQALADWHREGQDHLAGKVREKKR